jgi:hypothetical protein
MIKAKEYFEGIDNKKNKANNIWSMSKLTGCWGSPLLKMDLSLMPLISLIFRNKKY